MLGSILDEFKLSIPQGQHHTTARGQTAWLDGLRGYAALLVFVCHFSIVYWNNLRYAFATVIPQYSIIPNGTYFPGGTPVWNGTNVTMEEPVLNTNPIQLPIIRLLTDGDPMVVIFFIVSGYSLSLKPVTLMRKGAAAHAKLLTSLASSVVRRPIRLLVPIICSTLIVVFAVVLGLYSHAARFASESEKFHRYFKGWAFEATPKVAESLNLQMEDWFYSMYDLLDFSTHFHWTMSRYDIHLWTIPVEFRCSLMLFITQLGTSQMSANSRLVTLTSFVILALTWGDMWEMALFWAGMLLCELDMTHPPSGSPGPLRKRWIFALFVSLYLLSMPMVWAPYTPFYAPLTWLHVRGLRGSEQSRFWQCLGAGLLMICVSRIHACKAFFSNSTARFLGRISYALYLVHGPILRSLGYSTAFSLWQIFGRETRAQYNFCVFLTALVVGPAVLVAANVFCKRVDEPIVRFARWAELQLMDATEDDTVLDGYTNGHFRGHEREQLMRERVSAEEQLERGLVGRPSLS
ncbi:LEC14B protein [Sphaceloma murrayae]|uniref:LEC14B protein n=1 Tax=Sphaceloma murrayae TaxID=2082308 RepID=A0A2K1QWS6_9PEZI|nr:LEC14B protein [Sphaceloma murrayae]